MVGQLTVRKSINEGEPFSQLSGEHSTFWFHGAPKVMSQEHWHNHIEFNFIKGGNVHYIHDGHEVTCPSKQLIFFWAAIPHRMSKIDLIEKEGFYNFHYPFEEFLSFNLKARLYRLLLSGHILSLKAPAIFIEQIFDLWHTDTQNKSVNIFDNISSDITALLSRFSVDILAMPQTGKMTNPKNTIPNMFLFIKILRYIFERFQENISNQDIAVYLGYHENYIQRIFKDFSGYSIRQFIISIRLKYACSLLRNTERSIFNIVIETGFGSTSRFYKAFVDNYKITPKQYRQKQRLNCP